MTSPTRSSRSTGGGSKNTLREERPLNKAPKNKTSKERERERKKERKRDREKEKQACS
jgi:hypothetical protein